MKKNTPPLLAILLMCTLVVPAQADQGAELDGSVTVTARKRAEALQDVPLSVSVLGAEQLEYGNIKSASDLYGRVPGLYFAPGSITTPTGSYNYLTIRGIGWNAGLEPAVGVFVDGMYQPQLGFDLAFLDPERIEVLRGPQGTLFGRNTQGGALNIVTRKPAEALRGKARFEYGRFDTLLAAVNMSGPIGEGLFAGAGVEYARSDGHIRNVTLNKDQIPYEKVTARGVLRATPTQDLEVTFVGDVSSKSYNELMRGVPLASESYNSIGDEEHDDQFDSVGLQMNIEYAISSDLDFTSITGYRRATSDVDTDTDSHVTAQGISIVPAVPPYTTAPVSVQGARVPYVLDHEFMSQELRLNGTAGKVDWLGGLYYFEQTSDELWERFLGAGVRFPFAVYIKQDFIEERQGWAAFGQASIHPTERVELTLGARYSDEDIETTGYSLTYTTAPSIANKAAQTGGDNVSLMASASYQFADDVLGYLTYAEGWKAGGINRYPTSTAAVVPYDDEYSKNYELGFKTAFADGRVSLNGAVYYIDITDQQLVNFLPPPPGGIPITAIENAASSEVRGVEIELDARPNEHFQFTTAIGYSDTKFKEFVRRFSATDQFDMAGLDFENVPELTATAAATYRQPLQAFDGSTLELYVSYRYVDTISKQDNFAGATSRNQLFLPSYDRLDGSVSLRNDNWHVRAYVTNILDSWDYTHASSDPFAGGAVLQQATPLPPRQFGIAVSRDF